MPEEDNFRETQYYAMLKERLGAQHVVAKTGYHSNCVCRECAHSWRGECMIAKCGCCTSTYKA
jgi:hypothetical protein